MKKEDLIILLLAAALLLAAIVTIIRGGGESKHGYGKLPGSSPRQLFPGPEPAGRFFNVDSVRHRV